MSGRVVGGAVPVCVAGQVDLASKALRGEAAARLSAARAMRLVNCMMVEIVVEEWDAIKFGKIMGGM